MTPIEVIGLATAIIGTALGLTGAWFTSAKELSRRHLGFSCWLINSPCLMISLACYGAYPLIPLNAAYWWTAYRGFLNTKSEQPCKKCVQCGTETCQTPPGVYEVVKLESWRDK